MKKATFMYCFVFITDLSTLKKKKILKKIKRKQIFWMVLEDL